MGLSPFGQAPQRAYAAKGGKQVAQSEQLQTQASWADTFYFTVTKKPIVYRGKAYTAADLFGAAASPVKLFKRTTVENGEDDIVTSDGGVGGDGAIGIANAGLDAEKILIVKGSREGATALDAGTYKLRIYGTGAHAEDYVETEFTISKLDISDEKGTLTASADELSYLGDYQPVKFTDSPTFSLSDGVAVAVEDVELGSTDFDISPSQVQDRGWKAVTLVGKGKNVTGQREVASGVTVGLGTFATANAVTVNGVKNLPANMTEEQYATTLAEAQEEAEAAALQAKQEAYVTEERIAAKAEAISGAWTEETYATFLTEASLEPTQLDTYAKYSAYVPADAAAAAADYTAIQDALEAAATAAGSTAEAISGAWTEETYATFLTEASLEPTQLDTYAKYSAYVPADAAAAAADYTAIQGALATAAEDAVKAEAAALTLTDDEKSAADANAKADLDASLGVSTEIDLTGTEFNPTEQSPDPAANGLVLFGKRELVKGTDYKVEYTANGVTSEDFPTAVGRNYEAKITVQPEAGDFDLSVEANNSVTVKYNVTGASLDEVATTAEFGSATFAAANEAMDDADKPVKNTSVVAPTSAKFLNGTADVTSRVADNYELLRVEKWTAKDEEELLGTEVYRDKDHYPYADEPYKNDNVSSDVAAAYDTVTRKDAANQHGFKGLAAGDYKLYFKGDGELQGGEELYGKFTVAPAKPVAGTAVGQIVIAPQKAALGTTAAAEIEALNALSETPGKEFAKQVTYRTSTKTEYSVPFVIGDDEESLKPTYNKDQQGVIESYGADCYATFEKGGKEFTEFTESGEYDIVLHFGANFGNEELRCAGALTVGKQTLESYLEGEKVGAESAFLYPSVQYYTAGPATAEPVLLAQTYDEVVAAIIEAEGDIADQNAWNALDELEKAKYIDKYIKGLKDAGSELIAKAESGSYTLKTVMDKDADSTVNAYASVSGGKAVGVGQYTATLEGAGDYSGSYEIANKVVVGKLDISNAFTTVQFKDGDRWTETYSTVMGDATKVEPEFRLVVADTKNDASPVVVPEGLYTYKFENNTEAQLDTNLVLETKDTVYTAAKSGVKYPFYIAKTTFAAAEATVALDKKTAEYDGLGHTPEITVTPKGGTPLIAKSDTSAGHSQYVWTITNEAGRVVDQSDDRTAGIVDAGKYTITITGGESAEYAGTLTESFEVTPKEIKQSDVGGTKLVISGLGTGESAGSYTAKEQEAVTKVTYQIQPAPAEPEEFSDASKDAEATGALYAVEGGKATDAGDYTATITFSGNYTGTVTKDYTIKPQTLEDLTFKAGGKALAESAAGADDSGVYSVDYNGKAQEPAITVYSEGTELADVALTYIWADNVNASKYNAAGTAITKTASVTLIGSNSNYTGRTTLYFKINGYDITSDRVAVTFNDADLVETGQPLEPVPTVTYTKKDGEVFTLKEGTDFTLQYSGERTKAGDKGVVKIIGADPNFVATTTSPATFVEKEFTVQANTRADQQITVGAGAAVTKAVGSGAFALNATTTGDSVLEYATSDAAVATVDSFGNVTPVGQGKATITVTAPATAKFNAATATVELTVTAAEQQKAQTITASDVTVAAGKTAPINAKASGNGILTYATSNPAVATVSATGVVTGVKAGTAIVTIEAGATASYAAATKAIVVTVTAAPAPTPAQKLANPVVVKVVKKSYKAKAGKKTVLKAKKVFKVTNNKGGKVTYKKANKAGGKKITVSKKGKVVVKKGLKAGPYKVKVKATAKAKGDYKKAVKTVTVKVKVAEAKK